MPDNELPTIQDALVLRERSDKIDLKTEVHQTVMHAYSAPKAS